MDHGEVLARYLGAFIDELTAQGVTDVCICPGSRSTPLALLFARHERIKTWIHLDERSCSYFALGMAKATHRPVAILCTSGSAALNFAPAVAEAYQSGVPLLVFTADRPPELRELGANQTIDQQRLYGSSVKWYAEMLLPEATPAALRHARLTAARAVSQARTAPIGPVHLNFPFREPLVPAFLPPSETAGPRFEVASSHRSASPVDVSWLSQDIGESQRGLIVAGPHDPDVGYVTSLCLLARHTGFPVLADPLSGLRANSDGIDVVSAYDSFLRVPATQARLTPDLILRFGAQPTSKPLQIYLQRQATVKQVLVSPPGQWRDPDLTAHAIMEADETELCNALTELAPEGGCISSVDSAWQETWAAAEAETLAVIGRHLMDEQRITEPGVILELADILPAGAALIAGNSMPVRDLDTFFPATERGIRLMGNRGTSGIDGVISTALGVAAVSDGPTVLVIGDLSFYHDMNGLLAANRFGINATIVLVNNDGGGIFSFLPQNDDPEHFEALFGTPHGLDFAPVAQLYGLGWQRVFTRREYREALTASFAAPGVQVIEVKTDRVQNLLLHHRIWKDVAAAVSP